MRTNPPSLLTAVLRGFRLRCPACGQANLFRKYLKPVATCPKCGADFSGIRADDGPAWLTVLSLGPFLVPLAFLIAVSDWPALIAYPALAGMIVGAVLLLLPRMKGVVIGALHASRGSSG